MIVAYFQVLTTPVSSHLGVPIVYSTPSSLQAFSSGTQFAIIASPISTPVDTRSVKVVDTSQVKPQPQPQSIRKLTLK